MNLHDICEALYALPSGRVVARRRIITKALATMLLGVALLITNIFAVEDSAGALSMTLMVVGISLAAYGLIRCIVIASSKECIPYDTKRGEYMRYRERYYDRALLTPLRQALDAGDVGSLDDMPTTNIAAITVAEYRTSDGSLAAYAIYEYHESGNERVSDIRIVER